MMARSKSLPAMPMPPLAYTWRRLVAQAHDGDVQRAAAEVEDEHVLGVGKGLLVVQGGGDRLQLEVDLLKASHFGSLAQDGLGLAVVLGYG